MHLRPPSRWALAVGLLAAFALSGPAAASTIFEGPSLTLTLNGQTHVIDLGARPGEKPGTWVVDDGDIFCPLGDVDELDPDYDLYPNGQLGFWIGWEGIGTDADPFVTGAISVLNFTGSTQTFTLNFLQPVFPAMPAGFASGSIAIQVQDVFNSGSASLASAGGAPIYNPQIDGGLYAAGQLLANTTLNVTTQGGTTGTSASFGTFVTGPVTTSIGLEIEFSLTNLDLATGTSIFEVIPVPEPSGLALVLAGAGCGLVGGIRRRMRR